MNSNANQTPGLGLPQPSFEVARASAGFDAVEPLPLSPEVPVSRFEVDPHIAQKKVALPTVTAVTAQTQPSVMPMPSPSQQLPPPLSATPVQDVSIQPDDDNALDDEWVNKARGIVARTHNDPYLQSKEISKIKVQYIKVRYNKDIKSNDD